MIQIVVIGCLDVQVIQHKQHVKLQEHVQIIQLQYLIIQIV